MGKDPAMPLYVNDWLSSPRVQSMTELQELAYFRLCLFCWASGDASLPDDDEQLAVMSRMGKQWFKGTSRIVQLCFKKHPTKPQALTNDRVYELWEERQKWREKARLGGLHSAATRCKQKRKKGTSTTLKEKVNTSSSSSSSSGIGSLDSSSSMNGVRGVGEGDRFEEFWAAYPAGRKDKKGDAREAWKKAIKKAAPELIIAAAVEYAKSEVAGTRFVKGPSPWLNQECWDDDREAWKEKRDDDPRGTYALLDRYALHEGEADVIDEG